MPKYELIYFNLQGRAEVARMCFAQGGIDYEDTRIEREAWPALKPTTPFGQMPVLKVDGVQLSQSSAITRYVARLAGLYGSNELEAAQIDMWSAQLDDVQNNIMPAVRPMFQGKPEETAKLLPAANEQHIQPFLKQLVEHKKKHGKWMVGGKVSYVDFALYNACKTFRQLDVEIVKPHVETLRPNLREPVESLPKIKEWFDKRPVTDF